MDTKDTKDSTFGSFLVSIVSFVVIQRGLGFFVKVVTSPAVMSGEPT